MNNSTRVLYLSHGGGPLPLLGDVDHQEMVQCLKTIASDIEKPTAILVISAHWEASVPTVTAGASPELNYDYYGFPEESYDIQYPCAGEPQLAQQVHAALSASGIDSQLDTKRGFDHGLFVPLKIMFPQADIPCVQLSLVNSLDPQTHIDIGKALQQLDYDNLLIIGSGFSFHNMQAFFAPETVETRAKNLAFNDWLLATLADKDLDEAQREQRLKQWAQAPSARYCHPREEHLLPLHVCYGSSQSASNTDYHLSILKKKSSMFLW